MKYNEKVKYDIKDGKPINADREMRHASGRKVVSFGNPNPNALHTGEKQVLTALVGELEEHFGRTIVAVEVSFASYNSKTGEDKEIFTEVCGV